MIMELSGEIPVKLLCKAMSIQRSSFYAWKKHLSHPSEREKNLASNVRLFQEYHSNLLALRALLPKYGGRVKCIAAFFKIM